MRLSDALKLITLLNRAGLLPATEGQAEVWALALGDTRPQDAFDAARHLLSTRTVENRWTVPGDVLTAVAHVRSQRVRTALAGSEPSPPPELDPDNVQAYQAWRRTLVNALGDGQPRATAEAAACAAAGIPHTPTIQRQTPRPALETTR